ncbi:hypothetical protein SK128_027590, partial [Halocaridina rubra]
MLNASLAEIDVVLNPLFAEIERKVDLSYTDVAELDVMLNRSSAEIDVKSISSRD